MAHHQVVVALVRMVLAAAVQDGMLVGRDSAVQELLVTAVRAVMEEPVVVITAALVEAAHPPQQQTSALPMRGQTEEMALVRQSLAPLFFTAEAVVAENPVERLLEAEEMAAAVLADRRLA